MVAILILLAALATLLDFVFLFSCPWVNLIRSDQIRRSFGKVYLVWGVFSMIVGVLCLPLLIVQFLDYSRQPPEGHHPASTISTETLDAFMFAFGIAVPIFPLVLGYILRRFSSELRRESPLS